jgi:hypothetical protein
VDSITRSCFCQSLLALLFRCSLPFQVGSITCSQKINCLVFDCYQTLTIDSFLYNVQRSLHPDKTPPPPPSPRRCIGRCRRSLHRYRCSLQECISTHQSGAPPTTPPPTPPSVVMFQTTEVAAAAVAVAAVAVAAAAIKSSIALPLPSPPPPRV